MDERVARLDPHLEYVRRDLDDIKSDLRRILARLDGFSGTLNSFHTGLNTLALNQQNNRPPLSFGP